MVNLPISLTFLFSHTNVFTSKNHKNLTTLPGLIFTAEIVMHVKVSFIILLFKLKDINLQLIAYNICDVNNQYMLTPKWVSPISFIISHSVTCLGNYVNDNIYFPQKVQFLLLLTKETLK